MGANLDLAYGSQTNMIVVLKIKQFSYRKHVNGQ
jgi:hypothetical protein